MTQLFSLSLSILLVSSCTGQSNQKPNTAIQTQLSKHNTDNSKWMSTLDSLSLFLKEDKYKAGAAGWEGYSGAHDPKVRSALSEIVNNAITDFIILVQEQKATEANFYQSAHHRWQKIIDMELELETDEKEVTYRYFSKLFRLVGLAFDEEQISSYKD